MKLASGIGVALLFVMIGTSARAEDDALFKIGKASTKDGKIVIELLASKYFMNRVEMSDFSLSGGKSKKTGKVVFLDLTCVATLKSPLSIRLQYASLDEKGINLGGPLPFGAELKQGEKTRIKMSVREPNDVKVIKFYVDLK